MRNVLKPLVVGSLLLLGAGCADLEVVNYNAPDAARAISRPEDVEALISASYNTWWLGHTNHNGPGPFWSNQAFQHNAPWANFGMEQYGRIPRISTQNNPADTYYGNLARPWTFSYRAIAAIADGLKAIEKPEIQQALGATRVARAKAFGKFVQAAAHATIALIYDEGFLVTETTDLTQPQKPMGYKDLMKEAEKLFDEAIARCNTPFTLEYNWMSADVDNQLLARLARTYKARFMAQVARTKAERQAANWDAIMALIDQGITQDFIIYMEWDVAWFNGGLYYSGRPDWGNLGNYIHGMADTSGNFQRWVNLPDADKSYQFADGTQFLYITPDRRYPQGTTLAEQRANPGTLYRATAPTGESTFARPDRGTWRWSWYKHGLGERYYRQDWNQPDVRYREMRLLKAEGHFWKGQLAQAAEIINETRVPAGLNATNAAGLNTSCVPRLPNGQCGDLWEMLKWERRHASLWTGIGNANWFFDSRGWDDLYKGTPLHFGIPCREIQVLQMEPCKNYGGPGGEFGSKGSTYRYPFEGA